MGAGKYAERRARSGASALARLLAHRLAEIPEMPRRYRAELERLLDQVWNERALAGELQRMAALLEPALSPAEWRQTRLAIAGDPAVVAIAIAGRQLQTAG